MASTTEIERHETIISDSINTVNTAIEDAAVATENRLAEVILAQGTPENLANNRAILAQAFQPMREVTREMAEPLANIADDSVELQNLGAKDSADTTAQSALLQVAQNSVDTEIENQQNSIIDEIVIAAIGGVAVDQLARQARVAVSGIFAQTDNAQTTRLQRQLRQLRAEGAPVEQTQTIVQQLRNRLAGATIGANLTETVRRKTQDAVTRFEGAFTLQRAKRNRVERYQYVGGVIESSRDFCTQLDGAILTEEEIYDIWNSQEWGGKQPGDPFVVRGGYNCRHFFVPVREDE